MKGQKFIAIISIVCILAVILCIPAFATVTESNGDGFSLFGGAKLPNLDGLDISLDDYPARIIIPSGDGYTLFLSSRSFDVSSAKPFVQSSGNYFYANGPAAVRYYRYNEVDSSWDFDSSFSLAEMQSRSLGLTKPIWANGNLIYDSSGRIVVAASVPISLDGYNLIEWDGDTTGLSSSDSFYSLSNYEDAVDGVAVYRYYSDFIVGNNFVSTDNGWSISRSSDNSSSVLIAQATSSSGIGAIYTDSLQYTSFIAYRPIESPPGEGGGTPDEPQPPFGAAEIYLKLHLYLLILQRK